MFLWYTALFEYVTLRHRVYIYRQKAVYFNNFTWGGPTFLLVWWRSVTYPHVFEVRWQHYFASCQQLEPVLCIGQHTRLWFLKLSWILSGIQRAAQTVLGVYLKRTCSRVTIASSALGVLNDYALYKSTHSKFSILLYPTGNKYELMQHHKSNSHQME